MGARYDPDERNGATMKTIQYGQFTVEEFDSITEFVRVTDARPLNRFWMGRRQSSQSIGRDSFSGVGSYADATSMLMKGWREPLAEMRSAFAHAVRVKQVESKTRPETRYNVVGHTPSVPRAIMGIPTSMVETIRVPLKQKTVHLMFDCVVAGNVSKETITKGGVTVLETVATLERLGYRVKLTVCGAFVLGKGIVGSIVMKDYRQPLDIAKMCFPLAHGAMLRRIFFRWVETSPITPEWYDGYGHGSFDGGYGDVPALRKHLARDNAFFLSLSDVRKAEFDASTLMTNLGIAE